MSKLRVHELAKTLEVSTKELIEKLDSIGIKDKKAVSSLDEESVEKVKALYNKSEAKADKKPEVKNEEKPVVNNNNNNNNRNNNNNNNNNKNNGNKNAGQNNNNNRNNNNNNNNNNRNNGNFNKNNNNNRNNNNNNNFKKNNNFNNNNNNFNGKKNKKNKGGQKQAPVASKQPEVQEIFEIAIPESISIKDLAEKIKKAPSAIVMALMKKGIMANINQEIDFDTVEELCMEEFNIIVEHAKEIDIFEEAFKEEEDDEKSLVERPPVVVVMGHVDHGKTSLLDAIRHSHVTAREAGGITQHIGAYTVSIDKKPITFLDTPGHEAFTAMRMRGAQVTDIAILVVAADDGVMPQTIEAINHAKAAGVEIIVAINKIDKPGANPDRVKQELVEYGLVAEDWGGETICVPVSAQTKEGIDNLLEMIILVAEMKELKANPNKRARGNIIEAQLDKGRGAVATVLVQSGTLHVGDPIVAGTCYGRIRAMMNDRGQKVKKAGPSMPVEILGLNEVPMAGDMFYVAENERKARQVAESVVAKDRVDMLKETPQKVSLDDLFSQIQSGNIKELNIVIKADVQGSVEAVKSSLVRLSNDEVVVKVIHGGVGNVNESDVVLASASNAIIIAFNVKPDNQARIVAEREKVDLRLYSVIYNAIEDVEAALKGMLEPIYEEKIIGHARIMQIFKASGVGNIAGCIVEEGRITRDSVVRITRGSEKVYEGPIASLKHFKDEVKEIKAGTECGMVFEKFNDIQPEDMIEAHIMVEVPR